MHDPAVLAMERVLEAERAGETELEICRQQAQATIAASRGQAAAIARNADARLSRARSRHLGRIEAEIETLKNPQSVELASDASVDDAALAAVARRLAAKLTV